ncbi:unnamed protein product, partial [Pocillopora meandrina]
QNECASIIQRAWRRLKLKRLEFQNKCAVKIQKASRLLNLNCKKRKSQEMSDYPTKMRRVDDLYNVDFQDLFEVKKLGEGGFGEVAQFYCRKTHGYYAVKTFKENEANKSMVLKETIILLHLAGSSRVTQLCRAFTIKLTKTALALEYLPGGDFAGVLRAQGGKLSEERASRKEGWVLAIDPVTYTVVLQEETDNLTSKKLTYILGHAITRVVQEENGGHRPAKINFIELGNSKEYSEDEILKRKGDLIEWLTKNRIPVTESSEDNAVLSVMGVLLVEPP